MSKPILALIFIVTLLVSTLLYFLPTILARKKPFVLQVFLVNLLLGWSFLGWVVALIWALKKPRQLSAVEQSINQNTMAELERLHQLYKNGVITDDEFDSQKQKLLGNQQSITAPTSTKKSLQIITAVIIVFAMLVGLSLVSYIVPKYIYGHEATARRFFNSLQSDEEFPSRILGVNYLVATRENSLPKIYDYRIIKTKEIGENKYAVLANITGRNKLGGELTQEVGLIIEKEYDGYHIIDSYNVIMLHNNQIVFPDDAADLQKIKAIDNLRYDVKITDWQFETDYFGAANGVGVIKNNSEYPVKFIKVQIKYYDKNNNVINSDTDYAVDSNELQPGESRNFSWYTSNCGASSSANIKVISDDEN